jgi:hypothetical protein
MEEQKQKNDAADETKQTVCYTLYSVAHSPYIYDSTGEHLRSIVIHILLCVLCALAHLGTIAVDRFQQAVDPADRSDVVGMFALLPTGTKRARSD